MTIKDLFVKSFYKVADPLITAFVHPIQVTKAIVSPKTTVKQVSNEFFSQPKSNQITQTISSGINYGLGFGATKYIATKGLSNVIATATPTGIIKKAATVGGLVIVENVVGNSPKIQQQIVELPSNFKSYGEDIAKTVESPTLENGLRILKEHPYLTGATLTTLLLSLGYSFSLIQQILNRRATQENTDAILKTKNSNNEPNPVTTSNPQGITINNIYPSPAVVAPATLEAPAVTPIKVKKKRKKKAKKKKKTRRSKKKKYSVKRKSIKRRKK